MRERDVLDRSLGKLSGPGVNRGEVWGARKGHTCEGEQVTGQGGVRVQLAAGWWPLSIAMGQGTSQSKNRVFDGYLLQVPESLRDLLKVLLVVAPHSAGTPRGLGGRGWDHGRSAQGVEFPLNAPSRLSIRSSLEEVPRLRRRNWFTWDFLLLNQQWPLTALREAVCVSYNLSCCFLCCPFMGDQTNQPSRLRR